MLKVFRDADKEAVREQLALCARCGAVVPEGESAAAVRQETLDFVRDGSGAGTGVG